VILGEIGGEFWSADRSEMNTLLAAIGLRHTGRLADITFDTAILRKPAVFEATLDPVLPPYPVLMATRRDLDALLEVAAPAREGGGTSILVATSPGGGYAASGFEMIHEPRLNRVRWLIDPFLFFRRAFRDDDWPKPDITTRSGRRIAFSHVEGDGMTAIDSEGSNVKPLPHLLSERIITAYPDIPTSVALRASDFDPTSRAVPLRESLRQISASANVELVFLADGCGGRPGFFLAGGRPKEDCRGLSAADIDSSVNTVSETTGSANIRLFRWAAAPSDHMMTMIQSRGLLSIAERESRFDSDYPSIAYVAPIARPAGVWREAYVGGDDLSKSEASTTVEILHKMSVTAARTESPRRLSALGLRYKARWLSEPDALKSIEGRLDDIRNAQLIPIATADYVIMANDFENVRVLRTDRDTWQVENRGAVNTVRFDEPDELKVDLVRSKGVLGETLHGGSRYVALDAGQSPAVVALGPDTRRKTIGLRESRWTVSHLERKACGWRFSASGFGPGQFSWYDVPHGDLDVIATRDGERRWRAAVRPDTDGNLSFVAPIDGLRPITFDVRCDAGATERTP
jgi:hypothetical protein